MENQTMAISLEGFSIRDYTSSMRTTNVAKSWPFTSTTPTPTAEEIQTFLPPLTTPKFRWWSNELAKVVSVTGICGDKSGFGVGEKMVLGVKPVMVCPVCLSFKAVKVNALNAHVDRCLVAQSSTTKKRAKVVAAMGKMKKKLSKVPKKRSIVEIFAVAPQIDNDNEEEEKSSEGVARKLKVKQAQFKKKQKKKKENSQMAKIPSPDTFARQLNGSMFNKKLEKALNYIAPFCKRKSSSKKSIPIQNKLKADQTLKTATLRHQKEPPVFPVHGILKNHTKLDSSKKCYRYGGDQANLKCAPQLERHVKFVGMDSILRETTRWPTQMRSRSKITSKFNDAPSESVPVEIEEDLRTSEEGLEEEGCDKGFVISLEAESRARAELEKWVADFHSHASVPTFASPNNTHFRDKGKGPFDEFVKLNHTMQSLNSSHTLQDSSIPRHLISTAKEGFNHSMETQEQVNVQEVPNRSVRGLDPFCHLFPKDFLNSLCSSDDWKMQRGFVGRNRCINEDFTGLPLNSQGELVQLQSNGGGFEKMEKHSTVPRLSNDHSVHNLMWMSNNNITHSYKKQKSYIEPPCPQDNIRLSSPKIYLNHSFGDSTKRAEFECQNTILGNKNSLHQLDTDLNLMNISSQELEKQREQIKSKRPTVRLMGKDVIVGESNNGVRDSEDGNILPTMTSPDTSLNMFTQTEWDVSPSRNSYENACELLEAQRNTASARNIQMKTIDPQFYRSHLDWHSVAYSLPFKELLSRASKFPQSYVSRTETLSLRSKIPVSTTSHVDCQHMLLNSARRVSNQSLADTEASAFQFPISTQDYGECAQRGSSQNFLPWLLNTSKQSETHLNSAPIVKDNPRTISPNTLLTTSPHHNSLMSHTNYRPVSSSNNFQSSSFVHPQLIRVPPGLNDRSSFSATYGKRINMHDGMSPKYILQKDYEYTTSKKKPKKRLATKETDSSKVTKKPNLDVRKESSSRMTFQKRVNCDGYNRKLSAYRDIGSQIRRNGLRDSYAFSSYGVDSFERSVPSKLKCNNHMFDSFAYKGKGNQIGRNGFSSSKVNGSGPTELNYDGYTLEPGAYRVKGSQNRRSKLKDSYAVSSSKVDGFERSGPTKLSAGAKHILKPSEVADKVNACRTLSTIPFGELSKSGKVSEFLKKSENIYKFSKNCPDQMLTMEFRSLGTVHNP
ncbi:hypothetical protein GIB67_032188 [Kingdonia uniflora]|uniref:UBZ4-type domain-containing protein n=1 Tax=Kingdonia uniflora TaxID=39325 RepID=A0A7J7MX65_9MAGN|nr:hypothetical protein GIB67_032188 [Kingdonia uniflora]